MEHDVTIVKKAQYYIEYLIDGRTVLLNRTGATVDLTIASIIAKIVSGIEEALITGSSLIPYTKKISGKNLFRILDAVFFNIAFQEWQTYFDGACNQGKKAFKCAFVDHYGFYHSFKSASTSLYYKIREAAEERKHFIKPELAESSAYSVVQQTVTNNVVTYLINGNSVDICLRGKPKFKHAGALLDWLTKTKNALCEGNPEEISGVIQEIGSKAFLQIAHYLYDAELTAFLVACAKQQVMGKRELLKPSKIIKHFFGMEQSDYYFCLLSSLEKMIPWANSYLYESNLGEIASEKTTWVLFEQRCGELIRYTTTFVGSESYINSVQNLCRKEAEELLRAERPFVVHIHSLAHDLSTAYMILSEIGAPIETVEDIYSVHLGAIRTYLSNTNNRNSSQTQRRILYGLKSLYDAAHKNQPSAPFSPFEHMLVPKRKVNPTMPISTKQMLNLPNEIKNAPLVIQIAMAIAIATGARANSICALTTSDFSFTTETNTVTVTLFKTLHLETHDAKLLIQIDNKLAQLIQDYITKTADLRSQLDCPYLLVYRPSRERAGSHRKPKILTPNSFAYHIKKHCGNTPIYDANGFPITCAFKTIRATVGRELFLSGISEEEAAKRMGNTTKIKAEHYTTLFPEDEAKLRHEQYEKTVVSIMQSEQSAMPVPNQALMYGTCDAGKTCNRNNCTTCHERIVKRGGQTELNFSSKTNT